VWIRFDQDVITSVELDQVRLRDFGGSVHRSTFVVHAAASAHARWT
jgi:hypothetical protein